jgi:aminoglycoside phosphotransferase (APT) family kinase protein
MSNQNHAGEVARNFQIEGELTALTPYGSGHINDTYCAVFQQAGLPVRFILQRINTDIFRNPVALMENVQRVTAHLAAKSAAEPDIARRVLTLIPARDSRPFHVDAEDGYWRAYRFIEGAHSYDAVESTQQAYQAARAFGQFQRQFVDLPAPPLHSTIPGFHDTPKRFAAFEHAAAGDVFGRAVNASAEIDFAFAHQSIAGLLLSANLPLRVTHNDTKFNNVLLDDATGEAICVIDLDTVMPGLALYDFGDMVRTATSPAMEDERNLDKVTMQFPMFEALLRGYLSSAGSFLSRAEKMHLAVAGKVIAFEQGLRFLSDFLSGDAYYKIHRDGHNLDRCRTQFKLVESLEQQEEEMKRLVNGQVDLGAEKATRSAPGQKSG